MVDVAEQYPGQLAEHPSGPRSSMRRFVRRRSTIAVLMCVPLIVIVAGLIIYPALYSIYLSMLNKAQTRFVGLDNFSYLLKRDTFWMVVQQSAIFALSAVFFKALIGLVTAHLVNNLPSKGQRKWRGMLLVPWVIPLALSTLGWWWLFDPTHSAFNWLIKGFGGTDIPWLSDPYWARISVILVNVWYGAPFFLIMYLAALKSVPEQLYEAAAIDGANAWQRFLHITLPMMRNIIAITVLFSLIVTSLKTAAEVAHLATNPWIIANGVTLEQYRLLFRETDFLIYFKNTVVVTLCVVAITMVVSVLAAFSLSRMRFWGSGMLATGIFLTYLIPDTLLFIPLFQIVRGLGLLNSYWSMVLVYPTLTVPFCTWIMIGYFQSIPKELDEAALIDGAGHMQMLLKIFIPVALPGIIAATIFAFTVSWAAFVYPIAFLFSADQQVLTVGTVTSLIKADVYKWGMLMAGALVAAAPPLVVYAFLMDYYIAGLTAGATKG